MDDPSVIILQIQTMGYYDAQIQKQWVFYQINGSKDLKS